MDVIALRQVRWRWLARLLGLGALLMAILACGASLPPEMIPVATLEPDVAAFRVVSLAGGMLQARDGRDGALQWQTHVGVTGNAHLTASANAQVVYVGAAAAPVLTAVDAANGHSMWQFTLCSTSDGSILLAGDHLYLTCGLPADNGFDSASQSTLYALDATTGSVVWKVAEQRAQAVVGANVVTQTTSGLAEMSGENGAVLWQHSVTINPSGSIAPLDSFHFVVRATPTALYYSPDGTYVEALRAMDGSVVWRSEPVQDTASAPNYTFVQHASVALATSSEIVTQGIFGVTVLRASDGVVIWRYYQYPDGGGISTMIGEDGSVYVANYYPPSETTASTFRDPLAALNPSDGSLRWVTEGPVENQPLMLLDGDTLLAGEPQEVSAFSTEDGTRRWIQQGVVPNSFAANSRVECVQAASRVSPQAGSLLYLLKVSDGLKVWEQTLPALGQATPLLLPV